VKGPFFIHKPAFRYALSGFFCAIGLFGLVRFGRPVAEEFGSSFAMKEFRTLGIYGTYKHHFFSFVDRVDEFAGLDRENDQLNRRLAELEKERVLHDAARATRDLASLNDTLEESLRNEAGSELATALNSIRYEVPAHLAGHQLHALALGHFKREDHEKAAVILHHLLNLKEDSQFRNAGNHLMCGISWYQLKNYHLALRSFKETEKLSSRGDALHRKAVFWQALVYRALGKKEMAEKSMLRFIEWYPRSPEADWLNGKHSPASSGKEEKHEEPAHHEKTSSHH
jgi:tetratricopeptide (TPR) repeat protein